MNCELNELIDNADIVRFIKSRRIAWLGHVMRMDDKRKPQRILEWKAIGTRIRGRPRKRWIVDIEEDMQIMGIRRQRKQCKERAEWKRVTEKDDKRTPKRILEWKPIGMRIRGRPRKRWIVDIEEDMQIMEIRRQRKQCKERAEWKRITEKVKTLSGL